MSKHPADASASALSPYNLPPGSLFANPYGEEFYLFTETPQSGPVTVNVISGLDTLILTQQSPPPVGGMYLSPDQDYSIWADTVIIQGPMTLPGSAVTIWARTVQWQPDSNGNAPAIDVSGAVPVAPQPAALGQGQASQGPNSEAQGFEYSAAGTGAPGSPGANGNTAGDSQSGTAFTPAAGVTGGSIAIYAGSLDNSLAPSATLMLVANGGAGQNGQNGQTGQEGGNGGNGQPSDSLARMSWPTWPAPRPTPGGDGAQGGVGGDGGSGAIGGNGGTITVATLSASGVQISCSVQGGVGATGGGGGTGGNGGNAGANGENADGGGSGGAANNGGNGGDGGVGGPAGSISWFGFTPVASNVDGGVGGNGGNASGPGNPGSPGGQSAGNGSSPQQASGGNSGSAGALSSFSYTNLASSASSLQCSMMLQKGNLNYLSADPTTQPPNGFTTAAGVYNWLQAVILPIIQSGNGSPPGNQLAATDFTLLSDTYAQAQAMANQLVLRQDYFGNPFSYVPRVAYSVQQTLLGEMLTYFETVETNYQTYFTQLQQNQASYDQVVGQESSINNQIGQAQSQLGVVTTAAQQLVTTLNEEYAEIQTDIPVMDAAIQQYESDLIQQAQLLGCEDATLSIMKSVVGTITGAVTGKDAGFVAKIAGSATDAALTQALTAAGQQLGNDIDILNKVQVLLQDVASLAAVYSQDPNDIDAGTYKLLAADEQQLSTMLAQYTSVLPDSADGQAALAAINHFIDLVQQRNLNVMQYNSYLSQYVSLNSSIATLTAQLKQIESQPQNVIPGLPWIVAVMGTLYHVVRASILYQMYLTNRALGYWALQPSSAGLGTFVNVSDPAGINAGTLSAAQISLLSSFNSALESFGTGTLTSFPASGQPQGIVVTLTQQDFPAIFQALQSQTPSKVNQSGYVYTVSIPVQAVTAATTPSESPFADWADVRISTARPWIIGATTTGGDLTVSITHSGNEVFADPSNNVTGYTHESITATFEFEISSKAILRDADGFGVVQSGSGGYYNTSDFAPPGPFTVWTVTIDPDQNPGLTMSGVNEIDLEFRGAGYSFAAGVEKIRRGMRHEAGGSN